MSGGNKGLFWLIILMGTSYVNGNHLIGLGYSKDLLLKTKEWDHSNQLYLSYDLQYKPFNIGSTLRYYEDIQHGEQEFRYTQMNVNYGFFIYLARFNFIASIQIGLSSRSKRITLSERDSLSNDLLHKDYEEGRSKANIYASFGPRFKIIYMVPVKKWLSISPTFSVDYMKNQLMENQNGVLLKTDRRYSLYLSGGLCLGL